MKSARYFRKSTRYYLDSRRFRAAFFRLVRGGSNQFKLNSF
nr:MAG TPA: hypothetical protein [Caudoviricetes sp.]